MCVCACKCMYNLYAHAVKHMTLLTQFQLGMSVVWLPPSLEAAHTVCCWGEEAPGRTVRWDATPELLLHKGFQLPPPFSPFPICYICQSLNIPLYNANLLLLWLTLNCFKSLAYFPFSYHECWSIAQFVKLCAPLPICIDILMPLSGFRRTAWQLFCMTIT